MTNLYEINKQIDQVMIDRENSIFSPEGEEQTPIDFEAMLDKLQMQLNDKVENILKYMSNVEWTIDIIDAEIQRLSKLKQQAQKKHDGLKNYVAFSLQHAGIEKLDLGIYKLSFRKSESLEVLDIEQVPQEYKKEETITTVKVDKTAIKQFLKTSDGLVIPWTKLVVKQNLQIK